MDKGLIKGGSLDNAVIIKDDFASAHFNMAELVCYRGLLGMLFMWAWARGRGVSLATRYASMHMWRSLVEQQGLAFGGGFQGHGGSASLLLDDREVPRVGAQFAHCDVDSGQRLAEFGCRRLEPQPLARPVRYVDERGPAGYSRVLARL